MRCATIIAVARKTTKKSEIPPPDPMPARVDPYIEPGRVRILTRGGYDWTERFPTIAADARRLAVKTAILDGEAVVLDDAVTGDGRLGIALSRGRLGAKLPLPRCTLLSFILAKQHLNGHN